jgi:ADP-heptose:LPS heptosyltransferase
MIRNDCVYFKGETPCVYGFLCDNCPQFKPFETKILIIKRGAMGDVLRTTALLPGLKKKYPNSTIFWVVGEDSPELLQNHPDVNKIIPFNLENILALFVEKFDVLISLDKERGSTALAEQVSAAQKYGFGMNEHGNLTVLNSASEYSYRLGVDNDLKFSKNQKTYQEIIYEMAELDYQDDPYRLFLKEGDSETARRFFKKHRISKKRSAIGLNTGSGTRFETKQWPPRHFSRLIGLLGSKLEADLFLLGGPKEKALNRSLEQKARCKVFNTGNENSLLEFAGFISLMDVVVSSDSLAMHLAVALGKKVVALFGSTCPQEITLYGRGTKIFAGVPCSPCYKSTCLEMTCMKAITPEQVFREIQKIL